jgi:hypothetical protein
VTPADLLDVDVHFDLNNGQYDTIAVRDGYSALGYGGIQFSSENVNSIFPVVQVANNVLIYHSITDGGSYRRVPVGGKVKIDIWKKTDRMIYIDGKNTHLVPRPDYLSAVMVTVDSPVSKYVVPETGYMYAQAEGSHSGAFQLTCLLWPEGQTITAFSYGRRNDNSGYAVFKTMFEVTKNDKVDCSIAGSLSSGGYSLQFIPIKWVMMI